MSFEWPVMLLLVLAIPLSAAWYVWVRRRQQQRAAGYGRFGLAQAAAGRRSNWRRHIPPAVFLAGLAILVVALARPQTVVSLPRIEGTVILVVDVSGSMAADDVEPNRMEAAKTAAQQIVQLQPPGVQIGLVMFSDSGLSVQTPTNDQGAVLSAISRMSPQLGTSVGHGLYAALDTIAAGKDGEPRMYTNQTPTPPPTPTPVPAGTYAPAAIVLITDGENNADPDPLEAAQTAAERGVRVHTIGVGSAAGTILRVNGFTVHTRLDEVVLQQIAQLTGGVYANAADEPNYAAIYDDLNPELVIKSEKTEVTSLFAGASILVLLFGGALSLLWFSRLP